MSPRPNWDSPTPPRKRVCPPPGTKGGGHTCLRVRGSQFGRRKKKSLALCLLCVCDMVSPINSMLVQGDYKEMSSIFADQ
jgi:hypothetical protein